MDYQRRIEDRAQRRIEPATLGDQRAGARGEAGVGSAPTLCNVVYMSTGPELAFMFDTDDAGFPNPPWYDAAWSNRVRVTVDGTKVPAAQAAFPVYLSGSNLPAAFWSTCKADGSDIRVCSADGVTLLPSDTPHFSAAGAMETHCLLSLSGTPTDTAFYLYYGNAAATMPTTAERAAVWAGYLGVWHLGESAVGTGTADVYKDSAGVNHGDDDVSPGGKVGKLYATGGETFDGTNDSIGITGISSASTDNSVSMWVQSSTSALARMILLDWQTARRFCAWCALTEKKLSVYDGSWDYFQDTPADGAWHHLAFVFSGTTANVYLDGVPGTPQTVVARPIGGTAAIGSHYLGASYFYPGLMDEVRIAPTTHSADWVSTVYANQSDPGTFYSIGTAETYATDPIGGGRLG